MVAVAAAHTTTTLAQALTGQGRSSSCKIWEAYIQSHVNETFPYTSILLPSGFRSLYGRVLAYHTRVVFGGTRRRVHEGASPLKLPQGFGFGVRHPPARGSQKAPRRQSPNQPSPRHGQGKGRWSRASIDPYPSLVFGFGRRVNSAIRERVGLDLRERRPRRPVVTDNYIDPTTRPIPNRKRAPDIPVGWSRFRHRFHHRPRERQVT